MWWVLRATGFYLLVIALLACSSKDEPPAATVAAPSPSTITCAGCTVFRHVRVIDADGVRTDRRVLIDGEMIRADEPDDGREISGAVTEIDGAGKSLLPGLWDVHAHVAISGEGPNGGGDYSAQHLKGYLYSGVTSVVDTGSDRTFIFPLREKLRDHRLVGPHLRAVGPAFTVEGGHPCTTWKDPNSCLLVSGADSAAALVANLAPDKPDLLKVVIDNGPNAALKLSRMTGVEARAVVDAARPHQLRGLAHVSSAIDVSDALDAGVAALAHVPGEEMLSDELVARIVKENVAVMTTLAVDEGPTHFVATPGYVDDPLVVGAVPRAVLKTIREPQTSQFLNGEQGKSYVAGTKAFFETAAKNVARLVTARATVLAGSDAGNFFTFHGPGLHRELVLMVQAGMKPLEAITAATLQPARFFGVGDHLGRVVANNGADLLLVDGDPSEDISATQQIVGVWLDGTAIDREAMRAR